MSDDGLTPKDLVGRLRWRVFSTIPSIFIWETGVAMLEGALKYGRHNYRRDRAAASTYYDAALGHLTTWWEGENLDPETGLSHLSKAAACIAILMDAQDRGVLFDDRPPLTGVERVRTRLQGIVDHLHEKLDAKAPPPVTDVSEHPDRLRHRQAGRGTQ